MISKDTIDRIFDVAIIEEVIGDFVHLKRAGKNFRGLSPFTNEKTPSFYVVPSKGIYKCFSSGKGGNVVSFLMEQEKFSYPEALRFLAKKYNIDIAEDDISAEEILEKSERESLGIVVQFASQWFEDQMWNTEQGQIIGLSYFRERGFRDDIIKKFGLGYCPEKGQGITSAALAKGYSQEYLEKSGLTKKRESDGSLFDFFRGRVIFPIRNVSGKTVGFGARTLSAEKKVAKYFNSPESELYHKSRILYGIDLAKPDILKEDNCFLVEGYTDVISLYQAGVCNAVASSGTSLTEDQIRLIRRFTKNVTILYDGDPAGIRASFRGIDMLLKEGMQVRVVLFPDGHDPDSYSRKVSSDELKKYLNDAARDFIVFKTDILAGDAAGDPIKRAAMVREIVASIALIPDAIQRSVYTQECSRLLEIPEQTLISEINKDLRNRMMRQERESFRSEDPSEPTMQDIPLPASVEPEGPPHEEEEFVRLLLSYGDMALTLRMSWETEEKRYPAEETATELATFLISECVFDGIHFENELCARVVEEYDGFLKNHEFPPEKHFTTHSQQPVCEFVARLLTARYTLSDNWDLFHNIQVESEAANLKEAATVAVNKLKLRKVLIECNEIDRKLDQEKSLSEEEINLLLSRKIRLNKAKSTLSAFFQTVILR